MRIRQSSLALFAALALPVAAQAEEVLLKIHHFLPPTGTFQSKVIEPWCEKLGVESKGQIKCQIYPSMQLGGTPPQLLGQARDGIADVVWTLPGYMPGRFPKSEVFELPFMTDKDYPKSSRAFWDFVEKNAMDEFKGVKPLAVWVNGPYVFHFRDKRIDTLEGLKGVKVRAPSRLGNTLLGALGATPVGMPVPAMPEALAKGVIDGALIPWEVVPATKTQELTKFHAELGGEKSMTTATLMYVMNQKKYDSLSPELKKVIDDNSGREFSAWIAEQHVKSDAVGRKATVDNGNTIYEIPAAEMKKFEDAAKSVTAEWIKETPDGQRLHDEAVALVKKYSN